MKLNYFTLAALFFIPLSGTAQSENGYQFTTVVQQKATPVKDQAVAGALPPLHSSNRNYCAKAKANTTSRKCSSYARNT